MDKTEIRRDGLTYVKGTDKLADGKVVDKLDNGSIVARHSFKQGRPIGEWSGYDLDGRVVSHGFGVDIGKYKDDLGGVDLRNSFLSINIQPRISYATLFLANPSVFESKRDLIALAKSVFNDYSNKYTVNQVLIYDTAHEYTIDKSAVLKREPLFDTVQGFAKKKVFVR